MDSGGADWRALAHAEQLLDLRRDVEAEQRFRDVLTGDPGSGRALLGLGRALNRQDRHAEAEQVVRSALALDPEDAGAHHVLTDVLCDAGDGRAALVSARRGLQLDPTSFLSHYQHGRALLLVPERRERAQDSAERAISIEPHNADGHNLRGMCFVETGQLDRAQESYLEALSIDPTHAYAQNNLAVIAAARGRIGRAARLLRTAVAGAPQDRLIHRSGRSSASDSPCCCWSRSCSSPPSTPWAPRGGPGQSWDWHAWRSPARWCSSCGAACPAASWLRR